MLWGFLIGIEMKSLKRIYQNEHEYKKRRKANTKGTFTDIHISAYTHIKQT